MDKNGDSAQNQVHRIKLTEDEKRVLKTCQRDSFYYRCLPLGIVFMGTTHLMVARGILKPHPTQGSRFKCLGAAFVAYLLGKMSYQGICKDRILKLENSPMADLIRQAGKSEPTKNPYGDDPQQFVAPVAPPPSLPSKGPQNPPSEFETSVYDDLRDQNRQQFQRRQYQPRTPLPSQQTPPNPPPSSNQPQGIPSYFYPSDPSASTPQKDDYGIKENSHMPRAKRNIYGDVID